MLLFLWQVSFLHLYHHATISVVWGFMLNIGWGNGTVSYGAMINSFTHVLMYSHYLWTSFGLRNPLKKFLTFFQIGQFYSCQLHAWIVYFGAFQTTFPALHERFVPQHLALLQIVYHVTMIILFTFFLRWTPKWIAGSPAEPKPVAAKNPDARISVKQLAMHNSHDDCWLAIHGNVYDVTSWAPKHPGGDIILLGDYSLMCPSDIASGLCNMCVLLPPFVLMLELLFGCLFEMQGGAPIQRSVMNESLTPPPE